MDQLKQALLKAGMKATAPAPKTRAAVGSQEHAKKSFSPQKEAKKFHEHQIRNDCEYCHSYTPDVEYYRHTNKFVEVRWLCMKCADEYKILDECRTTNQSPDSRAGRFTRRWGPTKKF